MFTGRIDAEAETPILWPPHAKSWLIVKDPDAGRDWGKEEKGTAEDEMASLTGCTWVWVNSGSWWCTGRPGVLWFMGSQRVRHDWATELNWTEPYNRKIIQLGLTHSYEHIKRRVFSQLVTNRKSDIRSLEEIWVSCGSCNVTEPVRLAQGTTLQAECRSWEYFQTHSPQEKEALSPTTTRNWILPTNSMS